MEFEAYVRNYRREVIETIPKHIAILTKDLVIVTTEACSGTTYHRAKILSTSAQFGLFRVSMLQSVKISHFNRTISLTNVHLQVRLIDTGKILDCNHQQIFKYCGKQRKFMDLPPRCFECGLAQVQPSQVRYPNGHWPNEAIELFKRNTDQRTVDIEVNQIKIVCSTLLGCFEFYPMNNISLELILRFTL